MSRMGHKNKTFNEENQVQNNESQIITNHPHDAHKSDLKQENAESTHFETHGQNKGSFFS
jgi:hypothetical protein